MLRSGQVALVTGAGRGIGRGIALQLATQGATVVLNDLDQQAGAVQAATEIESQGGRALTVAADVRDPAAIERMVAEVVERFGRIDVLVNNAGIDPRMDFFEVTPEFWDNLIATNLRAAFFCAQAAACDMRKRGAGRIVNISSVHAQASMPKLSAYAASKGGIDALTRQMAIELAPFGITVNAVAPGCICVEKVTYDPAERGREVPLGRVGYPGDIAGAVAFLASEAAAWITGQVITVDGGTMSQLSLVGR